MPHGDIVKRGQEWTALLAAGAAGGGQAVLLVAAGRFVGDRVLDPAARQGWGNIGLAQAPPILEPEGGKHFLVPERSLLRQQVEQGFDWWRNWCLSPICSTSESISGVIAGGVKLRIRSKFQRAGWCKLNVPARHRRASRA